MARWRKRSPGTCDTQVVDQWHRTSQGEVLETPDHVLLNDEDWERLDDPPTKPRKTKPAAPAAEED